MNLRDDFPIFERRINGKPLVYFDSPATAQRPRQVIRAVKEFYENYNANIHRGIYTLSQEASEAYEEAHEKVAKFVNADSMKEIVFTRNATESLNLLAYSLGTARLQRGDEVVTTMMEHHSNFVPWQQLSKRFGFGVRYIGVKPEEGKLDLQDAEEKIGRKTKIVSMVHLSNAIGTINPVKEIRDITRDAGALFILDGAQSVPHMPVDVKKLDCDFLAWSGHKMLAPTGTGALYGKEELLKAMMPFLYGGDMISKVSVEESSWNELPWKFEAGTPHIAGGIGFGAAVDYLQNIGMDKVREHEIQMTRYAMNVMSEIPGLRIYGPKSVDERGGVVSFNIDGIHPHDLASLLDDDGIATRAGHHCAQPLMRALGVDATNRASFYVYNDESDIDKLAESLGKARRVLG
jgi:cysteine desulfurase/selenocysteine lyase